MVHCVALSGEPICNVGDSVTERTHAVMSYMSHHYGDVRFAEPFKPAKKKA